MSAIESSAPTSWKWTSSTGTPCTYASAAASAAKVAELRARTPSASAASASSFRIADQVRSGRSVAITSTLSFSARWPARVTSAVRSSTAPGRTASTAA